MIYHFRQTNIRNRVTLFLGGVQPEIQNKLEGWIVKSEFSKWTYAVKSETFWEAKRRLAAFVFLQDPLEDLIPEKHGLVTQTQLAQDHFIDGVYKGP